MRVISTAPDVAPLIRKYARYLRATPPLIGTSMTATPAAAHASSISRTKDTPTVQALTRVSIAFLASRAATPARDPLPLAGEGREWGCFRTGRLASPSATDKTT